MGKSTEVVTTNCELEMSNSEENQDLEDVPPEKVDELGFVVQQEAHRILSDAQLEPDPALLAEGWERRFIADGRRAKEMIDLYTELGYEVHVEPVHAEEFDDDCQDCGLIAVLKFGTIYTRKKKS